MAYELLELSTGNLVGAYDTQDAALKDVAAMVARGGFEAVETLALGYDDPEGDGYVIAQGRNLAELALAASPSTRA